MAELEEEGDGTVDAAWLISDDSDEEEYTESKKKAEKMRKEKLKQRMSPFDHQDRKVNDINGTKLSEILTYAY